MGNVVGEPFDDYVNEQIEARQGVHGSGVGSPRTQAQLAALNSRTSWIKFASGISISENKLKALNLPTSLKGMGLAKANVLFNGTSQLTGTQSTLALNPQPSAANFSGYNYSKAWGTVPMPGIESMDLKCLNRGSLEKATVKLKVYSREQFDIIDVLYLRLGYTVLLEWGNSAYTPNGGSGNSFVNIGGTCVEDNQRFFANASKDNYRSILGAINYYKDRYDANYDGLLGKVSNFNWSFNPDGSYDITITIISLGDVIESLKLDTTPPVEISKFINSNIAALEYEVDDGDTTNDFLTDQPISDGISAMLWLWKYINKDDIIAGTPGNSQFLNIIVNSQSPNDPNYGDNHIGGGLVKEAGAITGKKYTLYIVKGTLIDTVYRHPVGKKVTKNKIQTAITTAPKDVIPLLVTENISPAQLRSKCAEIARNLAINVLSNLDYNDGVYTAGETSRLYDWTQADDKHFSKNGMYGNVYYTEEDTIITTNPLSSISSPLAAFYIASEVPQFYLKLGSLLEYIQKVVIPYIRTSGQNPSIFNIDYQESANFMFRLHNQISLDPRVCIVSNGNFQKRSNSFANVFPGLDNFDTTSSNVAKTMNIYLNFNFITNSLEANKDDRGNVNVFGFIDTLCVGLNKALGGINNLEPTIDKIENKLYILDATPIPGINSSTSTTQLEMYGYNGSDSNFVRNIDLKTAITPEYATMITVGATAGGYVKGTEGTAFSKWNTGLEDRFNHELVNNILSTPSSGSVEDEALENYSLRFLRQVSLCYGFTEIKTNSGVRTVKFVDDVIDNNVAIVSEFYRYLQAKNKDKLGNSVGFIPFKLGLTLDGISGIKIYNKLNINSNFLPSNYGNTLDLLITGVNHKLSNNDWETSLETMSMPITQELADFGNIDFTRINRIIASGGPVNGGGGGGAGGGGGGGGGGTPPSGPSRVGNATISTSSTGRKKVKTFSTIISSPKTNTFPIIVPNEATKQKYLSIYGSQLGSNFSNFIIRPGNSNPNSEITKFKKWNDLQQKQTLTLKAGRDMFGGGDGGQLGNGADITPQLVSALQKLQKELLKPKYAPAGLPWIITAGNDKFHHGKTQNVPAYEAQGGKPWNTTHVRGIALDLQSKNVTKDNLIIDALQTSGFTDILHHSPAHIHANLSQYGGSGGSGGQGGSTPSAGVILMTGLTPPNSSKTHQQQISIFKQGYPNGDVKAFTYQQKTQLLAAMQANPTYSVVLFSAACRHAEKVAGAITDTSNLWMVEPFINASKTNNAYKGVRAAVEDYGVPAKNVQTGPARDTNRGWGILLKNKSTERYLGQVSGEKSANHFKALTYRGSKL